MRTRKPSPQAAARALLHAGPATCYWHLSMAGFMRLAASMARRKPSHTPQGMPYCPPHLATAGAVLHLARLARRRRPLWAR